jgi:hypothetical protein
MVGICPSAGAPVCPVVLVTTSGAMVGVTSEKCPPFTGAHWVRSGSCAAMVRWLLALACSVRYGVSTGCAMQESALLVMVCIGVCTLRSGDWPMRPPTPTMNGLALVSTCRHRPFATRRWVLVARAFLRLKMLTAGSVKSMHSAAVR